MTDDKKKLGRAIVYIISVLLFLGGGLFIVNIFVSLGLAPVYVMRVFPYLSIALVLVVAAVGCGYLSKKWVIRCWAAFGLLVVAAGIYCGIGAYTASIPTVDDRDFWLYDYVPGREDNKLATLPQQATLRFTAEEAARLRLDGATALYPVYAAFVQATYPEGEWELYADTKDGLGQVTCTGTVEAYERLIRGDVDVIFCAGPSDAQVKMAEKAGLQFQLTPIGKEAFVFFVNSKNPVTGLTVDEIRGIYSGEITNWKDVGGKWQRIRPFQRAENSGSQTSLEKLMEGYELMEPEKEDRIAGMGGIIRSVASYRNFENALGFSFRYFSTEMVVDEQIRLLALNGVLPTQDTIRDGSYPIASEFYAVTAVPISGEQPEPKAELTALLEWILSPQGQRIVEDTGYVAVK